MIERKVLRKCIDTFLFLNRDVDTVNIIENNNITYEIVKMKEFS